MPQRKQNLRKKLNLTIAKAQNLESLIANAQALIDTLGASTIAIYFPIESEPDLMSLIEANPLISFSMPKIRGGDMFFAPYNMGEEASKSARFPKILEPQSDEEVVPDIIFAPGIAFDIRGNRLGRGLGFYDKYIARFPHIKIIGVTFQEKLFESLQVEAHDCKMHFIVTEHNIISL